MFVLPGLSEDLSVVGLLQMEEQQVLTAQAAVLHQQRFLAPHSKADSPTRKSGSDQQNSPFSSPIQPVCKANGEQRLTVHYCDLNEFTPSLSAAVPHTTHARIPVRIGLKSTQVVCHTDNASAFFSIPLATECMHSFGGGFIVPGIVCPNTGSTAQPFATH